MSDLQELTDELMQDPEFVKEYSHLSNCNVKEDFEISKKDNSHLFVLAR